MDYLQVSFPELDSRQKDMLVALLAEAGYEGFEEDETCLHAFIDSSRYNKSMLDELVEKFHLHFKETVIKPSNWNRAWENSYKPVVVNHFCAIRAGFHQPVHDVEHEIIITPKMSFGTGHHETTLMMIQQMKNFEFTGKTTCDFGTGTGILAILAEKLGARKILAIDIDDRCIQNAMENIKENHCTRIEIEKNSKINYGRKFDIILANLSKNIIIENFSSMKKHLHVRGILLLSGILHDDGPVILQLAKDLNFTKINEIEIKNWLCFAFERQFTRTVD